jgi:hypothetical protein
MKAFARRYLRRPALILGVCIGALTVAGIAYAVLDGKGIQHSIAFALFIGGGVIAVLAGLGGGGQSWGSRSSMFSSGKYEQSDMQFGWVVVGVLLFVVGIAVLKA